MPKHAYPEPQAAPSPAPSQVGISSGAAPCLRALRCQSNWRCCTVTNHRPASSASSASSAAAAASASGTQHSVKPQGAACDADVCRRAASGGGEDSDAEGEELDRYGLPTHWYQPPFSTVVHGYAGDAAFSGDVSAGDAAGNAAADEAGADAAGDELASGSSGQTSSRTSQADD